MLFEARPLISFLCSRVYSDRHVIRNGNLFHFEGDRDLVKLLSSGPDDASEMHFRYRYGFKSRSSIVHMEVCKESFRVASKHYTLAFATDLLAPGVWFDFELDTLYLSRGFTYNASSDYGHYLFQRVSSDLCKVKNLALSFGANVLAPSQREVSTGVERLVEIYLELCPNVRDVALVSKRHDARNSEDLVFSLACVDVDATLSLYRPPYDFDRDRV